MLGAPLFTASGVISNLGVYMGLADGPNHLDADSLRELDTNGRIPNEGDTVTSYADLMSPEDAEKYLKFLEKGSEAGLTREEKAGIRKLDELIALEKVDYQDVLNMRDADEILKGGSNTKVEIIDKEKGTFIIKDWSDYPDDYVPVPDKNKVWRFLEGEDYTEVRDVANDFNRKLRSADPYYANNGLEIHEIEPVKMGGSPTDISNKVAIQSQVHRRYVTPWWNKIRDEVKKGLN